METSAKQEKKKILQIGYLALGKGGIQAVVMNIVRGLGREFSFDILLLSNKEGFYDEEFKTYGNIYRVDCSVEGCGKLKRYFRYATRPFKQFLGAYRLIKTNRYDVVHIHSGHDGGPMFLAAKCAGVKHIVAHSHNAASPEKRTLFSRIYRKLGQCIVRRTATVKIGVSDVANRYLYGGDASFIVNNPVDLEKFTRLERSNNDGKIVLANVGRYSFQKNQEFCVEILKALLAKGRDAELNLIGWGENEERLKKLINEQGLEKEARLIDGGGDADVPALLAASDVFVFPSRYEGLGIVALEAQAAGCLCVASDAVPKTTDLGMCEYLSLQEASDVWAEKIVEMWEHKERYRLNNEALEQFSTENVWKAFRELYAGL